MGQFHQPWKVPRLLFLLLLLLLLLFVAKTKNTIKKQDPRYSLDLVFVFWGFCNRFFCFYTLLSLTGNSGRLTWLRLQQPQEQRYPVMQVSVYRVSVVHRTLTWTDMIFFNVRA